MGSLGFKLVQMGSNVFKYVQMGSNWVQIGFKWVQIDLKLISNASEWVQRGPNEYFLRIFTHKNGNFLILDKFHYSFFAKMTFFRLQKRAIFGNFTL